MIGRERGDRGIEKKERERGREREREKERERKRDSPTFLSWSSGDNLSTPTTCILSELSRCCLREIKVRTSGRLLITESR